MKVLLADNDKDFLETRAEFLENAGYQVLKANTLEQAQRMLSEEYLHIAILDVRLVDDDDDKDISGLMLAQDPAYEHVIKIMFTNYPRYEGARVAMKPTQNGTSAAVNYLAKEEGPGRMIQEVREAFKEHVRINPDLCIRWGMRHSVCSFAQLIGMLTPTAQNSELIKRINEFEDLFRRLFYTYEQLTISRILWHKKDQIALETFVYAHSHEEHYVVVCGDRQVVEASSTNMANYATYLGQMQVQGTAQTTHFGALALSLADVDLSQLQSFAAFYRENTMQKIRHCVDTLVQTTLSPWMQHSQWEKPDVHIIQHFRERWGLAAPSFSRSAFDQSIKTLAQQALLYKVVELSVTPDTLTFVFPGGQQARYPNPGRLLYEEVALSWKGMCETAAGDLDVATLMVDATGQPWLTDVHRTPVMPSGYNLAHLESSLRFSLIPTTNFQTLWDFESQLLSAMSQGFVLRVGDVEPPYRKALGLIQNLHKTAQRIDNDGLAYRVALFMSALTYLIPYRTTWAYTLAELSHFLHALLFSAMLSDVLLVTEHNGKPACPPGQCLPLRMDAKNREVWIGQHQIDTSPTEFDLLYYLYERTGQLCRRDDIVRNVFGFADSHPDEQAGLINTNIGRLRKKIEVDPHTPRYIVTVRGQGYKLIAAPE